MHVFRSNGAFDLMVVGLLGKPRSHLQWRVVSCCWHASHVHFVSEQPARIFYEPEGVLGKSTTMQLCWRRSKRCCWPCCRHELAPTRTGGPLARPRSSIWLGNPRRRSRHALAATTGLRRPHPVTRSIRLALRLHAFASKLAHGGGRIWRCMWPSAGASPVRASALSRPSGFPPVPFLGRFDLSSIEEMPGKVGAPRELEATRGCQRCRLGARW